MPGQVEIQPFGQKPFSPLLVRAVRAALEMAREGRRGSRIQLAALILQNVEPGRGAIHVACHRA